MRYLLGSKRTLIVRGPASLQLLGGQATALGAPLESRKVVIRQEKQLPIETTSEADLDVVMDESGSMLEVDGSTIPRSWHSALNALIEMEQGKVVIVGAQDAGKSTLCTFLANGLLKDGVVPRLVDADIGQADIGPPTTLGKAIVSDVYFVTSRLEPVGYDFHWRHKPESGPIKIDRGHSTTVEYREASSYHHQYRWLGVGSRGTHLQGRTNQSSSAGSGPRNHCRPRA